MLHFLLCDKLPANELSVFSSFIHIPPHSFKTSLHINILQVDKQLEYIFCAELYFVLILSSCEYVDVTILNNKPTSHELKRINAKTGVNKNHVYVRKCKSTDMDCENN